MRHTIELNISVVAHFCDDTRPEEARKPIPLIPVLGEVVWHSQRFNAPCLHLVVLHVRCTQNVRSEPARKGRPEACSRTRSVSLAARRRRVHVASITQTLPTLDVVRNFPGREQTLPYVCSLIDVRLPHCIPNDALHRSSEVVGALLANARNAVKQGRVE